VALAASAPLAAALGGVTSSIWRVEPTHNPGSPSAFGDFFLDSVSARAANDGWAVGTNGLVSPRPLAEHWNGTTWTAAKVPMPVGAAQAVFQGVDELSSTDAWAVGKTQNSTAGDERTLIEHWDGTSWTVVPSPNPEVGGPRSTSCRRSAGPAPLTCGRSAPSLTG
jgi:hypothetical protein